MSINDFDIKKNQIIKYHGSDTRVVIPKGVTHIRCNAFEDCDVREVVVSGEQVGYFLESAMIDACKGCEKHKILENTMHCKYFCEGCRDYCADCEYYGYWMQCKSIPECQYRDDCEYNIILNYCANSCTKMKLTIVND